MKLSLIFLLLSLVAITQQQRQRAMLLYSPFFQQQASYNKYQLQPYYGDLLEDVPYFRHFALKTPLIDSHQNDELLSPAIQDIGSPDDASEYTGLGDIQSRTKGLSRYSPNHKQQQARFFFLLNSGTTSGFNNPFFKTVTFTVTSTLTLATVQSCIPTDEFVQGGDQIPCRRRRREISSQFHNSEDQFSIEPSQTLPVIPTVASPSSDKISWENDKEIMSNDQKVLHGVFSSKEDPIETDSPDTQLREKRYFNNNKFLVSSTTTTYLFVPTTIKKTVILVSPRPAGAGASTLNCLPASFIVC